MEFLITLIIFFIIIIIFKNTTKKLVYTESPANPNFNIKLVTFRITCKSNTEKNLIKDYTVEKILYMYKNLSHEAQIEYISNHTELYNKELSMITNQYKDDYGIDPIIDKIDIII